MYFDIGKEREVTDISHVSFYAFFDLARSLSRFVSIIFDLDHDRSSQTAGGSGVRGNRRGRGGGRGVGRGVGRGGGRSDGRGGGRGRGRGRGRGGGNTGLAEGIEEVMMRPPTGEQEKPLPVSKPAKERKWKMASSSKGPEPMNKAAYILPRSDGVQEGNLVGVPEPYGAKGTSLRGEKASKMAAEADPEAPRNGENSPSDPLRAIEIRDSPSLPSFSE
ncbi:PREDICTED: protein argonaute 2-like [Nicotiana attenuata]|uniref:protein argonaute 2-like n=1 Tax=Nicotiana attenuata TaxID=49451 RepID=UPI00090545EC|nr:PREDICTED: protein argonaute 2-like [Nicotiana attenuata]